VNILDRINDEGYEPPLIAEIGINHWGCVGAAIDLAAHAGRAGAWAVKFQKRTLERVYTPEELAAPRASVWGSTYGDEKRALEFGEREYDTIARELETQGTHWFASVWDPDSVAFMARYNVCAMKIPSACMHHEELRKACVATGLPVIVSVGMASLADIEAVAASIPAKQLVLCHTVSAYPTPIEHTYCRNIAELRRLFGVPVGYSGHEGAILIPACVAVVHGAAFVERHICYSHQSRGSDMESSLEPVDFARLRAHVRGAWLANRAAPRGDGALPVERQALARGLRRRP
jgi:N-acetylneuraminate synthase